MNGKFNVKLTADFQQDGSLIYQDIGLDLLDNAEGIDHSFFDQHRTEITPDQLIDADAIIALTPLVTSATLKDIERLTMISRFGVGYDSIDVDACTEANVALTITAGGVNYSVAESVITFMLAISHNLLIKDRLVRERRWNERSAYMGSELRDRTLGIIGLGGIGATLAGMVGSFRMNPVIAYDPLIPEKRAQDIGVTLVTLDELLQSADFVSVNCPLLDQTRNLIKERELKLMKSTAYLINTARGGIVNEAALLAALQTHQIAGAALDCHDTEPVSADYAFAKLDNVIMAPHSVAWTNELFRDLGRMACSQSIELASGKVPHGVVNKEVVNRPGFQAKLARYSK
ncbi:MAG: NAD(P)-dependent oxidoreductase [Candidatus Latescibacterota bacterium]|nr:NAD(P)-dependent oxidoreductase [Candidatus Latescibacterota bacterium]